MAEELLNDDLENDGQVEDQGEPRDDADDGEKQDASERVMEAIHKWNSSIDDNDDDEVEETEDEPDDEAEGGDDSDTEVEELRRKIEYLEQKLQESDSEDDEPDEATKLTDAELERLALLGPNEEQLKALREKHGEVIDSLVMPLVDQLNKVTSTLNQVVESQELSVKEQQEAAEIQRFMFAQEQLDKLSETFPDFGKSSELKRLSDGSPNMNDPRNQVRAEIFERASVLFESGLVPTWDEALDDAVCWYKGKRAEKEAERKIVGELNARKKKMTNRPSSKHTAKPKLSREEAGLQVLKEAKEKLGL